MINTTTNICVHLRLIDNNPQISTDLFITVSTLLEIFLNAAQVKTVEVIDTHTEGEPTRVIISGGPDLGSGSLAERAQVLAREHGDWCSALLREPRGHDAMVGALLCSADSVDCATGVIFFNSAGNLGMCGHASIGCAVVLAHLQRLGLGQHRFATPVGQVSVELCSVNQVAVDNVASYRYLSAVTVNVAGLGLISGDVAWGGNWFFLSADAPCALTASNIPQLSSAAQAIRSALVAAGISGAQGAGIDHIEFNAAPQSPEAQGRNFVLCPDGAYDRSPCGTGTSAKLACLAAESKLAPEQLWVQESIIGSKYQAWYKPVPDGKILPTIVGRAYLCAQSTILLDPQDPYLYGIRT